MASGEQTPGNASAQTGGASEMNPEFEQWIVNDQLLMGWLYGSMTESIATEVMGCSSSADLWSGLEALFGAHSKARMDEYRTKIQTVKPNRNDNTTTDRDSILSTSEAPSDINQLQQNTHSDHDSSYAFENIEIQAFGNDVSPSRLYNCCPSGYINESIHQKLIELISQISAALYFLH
ncbi:hypothetical protein F8388_014739 [Cannabis sativa]|uniref:Uncharacterized protein n=1 Tax=Cannabis sativa TaxID=3483 RepID=A0A7J6GYM1_CANSA|nr:hypothetical protein F8388_014739 [Cannabis sativa]